MLSFTVENYLKAIYHLALKTPKGVSTNAIAEAMGTKAASVSDMLRKLKEAGLIHYKKYQGVTLTESGKMKALLIIRKHRLWEVFLVEKLDFAWDEVHEIAEELEHIDSTLLVDRLDDFLNNPKFDPHGDPIPDKDGNIYRRNLVSLLDTVKGASVVVCGVKDSSNEFLHFLDAQGIRLGTELLVNEIYDYDASRAVLVNGKSITLSQQVCKNLMVNDK